MTLYEQNGDLVTDTLVNAQNQVVSLDENQKILNQTVEGLDSSPAVLLSTAFNDLQTASKPLLDFVAQLIADFARFASENIALVSAITAIVTVVGILAGAFVVLAPALGGIVTALPALTTAFAAITAPIALTVAAIVGLGAAFVALYQSSETFRSNVNSVFESIRDVAVQVFETIANFIGEQLQKIQQFWATNGEQILQAAQNVFNGIMAVVDFVFPAIQFVIQTVWDAIKDIISGALDVILGLVQVFAGVFTADFDKVWEGVKQIFSGAIDFVLGLMTVTFFGGIRTALANIARSITSSLTTTWASARTIFSSGIANINSYVNGFRTTVVNQFNRIKDGIVNAVKGIRLFEVGVDVIRGLVNGIKSFASAPVDAIRDIGSKMISGISKVLGRRSPAREFIAIGKDVDAGLRIGIERNADGPIKAMEDVGKVIIDVAAKNAKEVTEIGDAAEKERTAIQKKYADERKKAQEKSSKETQKTAKDRATKLAKINSDEAAALKKINDKALADMEKLQLTVNKNTLDAIQKFIKDKKDLNQISLLDEAEYYRAAYRQAVTGSEANIQLQRDYQNVVKQINDSITTVNQDFLNRTQKINDDLIKAEEDLNAKYKSALDSRYNTLVSAYGLFDEVASQDLVDPTVLVQNLEAQVNALQRFQNSIATFRTRGISGALLEDLQNLGPRANAELEALNRLTDEELARYAQTYETRSRIARETAVKELEPLAKDTEVQIQKLRDTANRDLQALNTEWQERIKQVIGGTEEQFKTLNQVGKNAAQNLLDGLTSVEPALLSKSRQIANDISKTISDALNLNGSANLNLNNNLTNSTNGLKSAVTNAQASLNSSAAQSNRNQTVQIAAAQSNNIDMNALVSAIGNLASRPIQTAVQLNGQTIAASTSQYQNSNYNVAALQKGVTR